MSLKIKSVPQLIDLVRNEPVNFTKTPQINGVDISTSTGITGRRELDTTYTPVALYNFNGNLEDSSATGDDLIKDNGTNRYYPNLLFSGSQSALFKGDTCYRTATNNAAHRITGDITLITIINFYEASSGYQNIVTFSGNNDGENQNFLYSMYLNASEELYWFQEKGEGVNVDYLLAGYPIPIQQWVVIGATRTSNSIQFYLNGAKLGPAATIDAPTGGDHGDCRLWIGAEDPGNANYLKAHVKSIKIISSALTEAQMMTEFERVTGDLKFI